MGESDDAARRNLMMEALGHDRITLIRYLSIVIVHEIVESGEGN